MTWWNNYVGTPFKNRGRTRAGADCWGLVRLVLLEGFNIAVPCYENEDALKPGAVAMLQRMTMPDDWRKDWKEITNRPLKSGDVMLWCFDGFASHVSIVVKYPYHLHTTKATDAVVESLHAVQWQNGLDSTWRHRTQW